MKNLILNDKTFMVLISIFYILGICGVFFNSRILLAFVALIILLSLLFYAKYSYKKLVFLYFIFFMGIIRSCYAIKLDTTLDNVNANNAKIIGTVVSAKNVSIKNKKVKFYLKTTTADIFNKEFNNINSKIFVNLDITDNINEKIKIGNVVEIKGKLRTPKSAGNPYQFDYKKYLENQNTKNILYGKTTDLILISAPKPSKNSEQNWYYVLNKFEKARISILDKHSQNIKSPFLEILGGIVFGDTAISPDEDTKENFKNSGLLHLLAASGLNVALIFGLWWHLLKLIKFPYNLSILSGAVVVVFYTFMTGFPPSILRASLMLLFVLLGKIFDKSANSIALIFTVGFLILLFNPKMLFDIGFQLSFIVTFGLVVCCPVLMEKFDKLDKNFLEKHKNFKFKFLLYTFTPKNLVSVVLVPLIAQIWVIPLQMHYFNNFAPLSILANIAVVPFIGILSFIGFISSIIALVPKFSLPVVFVFDLAAKPMLIILEKISEFFANLKYSLISTMGLNCFQIFVFWISILLLVLNIKFNFKNKKHFALFLGSSFIFLFSLINFDIFNHNLEIMMFDVGNADSFLVKTPQNHYILIDTGKKSYKGISSGTGVINPYLRNKRIKNLHSMVITHFDIDHCGGAIDVLEFTRVDNIYIQNERTKSIHSDEILKYLKANKLNYKIAKNNEKIYSENNLEVITYIPKVDKLSAQDKYDNETSIITLLKYKDKNILFMADSGILGYESIKEFLPSKIDILKIGHHGAKNVINQNMLNSIRPDYSLISAGISKFNHPHFETINLLSENNVKIISSKNYGFVKIIFNGDFIFKHFNNKKLNDILFEKADEIPFHKTKFTQDFIKNNKGENK